VSTARQQDAAETFLVEKVPELGGRDHGGIGATVETAQIAKHRRCNEAQTVVAREIVEACMEAGADGDVQVARSTQRRAAQRSLGCNVDGVGSFALPQGTQPVCAGQSQAQSGV
jgi:hypothetical protein